jgi:hypothetical protein
LGFWHTPLWFCRQAFQVQHLFDIWINYKKSLTDFGYEATVKHYKKMLTQCHPINIAHVQILLNDAKNNAGKTLIDIIVEIILDTNNSGHD